MTTSKLKLTGGGIMTLNQNDQFWSAGATQNTIWAANQLMAEEIAINQDPLNEEALGWLKFICELLYLEY